MATQSISKYATCQTSLAGIFRQNLEKYPSKTEKIFCSLYTQSNDSAQYFAQHLKMPQNREYNCFRHKVITGSDFAPIEIGFTFL